MADSFKDDLDKFFAKVNKSLELLTEPKSLRSLGDEQRLIIKRRSRLGYGVPKDGGSKAKFEELAASTKKSRKRKKEKGRLAAETTPNKSNLTESGELLNDLVSRIENRTTIIEHSKDRNKKIGAFHQTGSAKLPQRRYLGLAKEDIKQLTAFMQDRFNKILNNLFK